MARRPTPTAILEQRGSWRAAGREGEPDFSVEIPPCSELVESEYARAWYSEQAAFAAEAGIMSAPFGTALSGAAYYVQEYQELCADIRKEKRTYMDDRGNPRANPKVAMRNVAWDKILKILIEFGYTPAARSAIKVGITKPSKGSLESFNAEERHA